MLARIALFIAKALDGSARYKATKHFFRNLIENPHYPYKRYFDMSMLFLVISSIYLLIHEVKHPLPEWLLFYNYVIVTLLFALEYLLRLWIHGDMREMVLQEHEKATYLHQQMRFFVIVRKILSRKWEFIRSPAAIIDILAILPSFRELRVLRIFLLFRVFKVLRYTKSIQNFLSVLYSKKFELFTLFIFLSFMVFVAAVLIYVFEGGGENPDIGNFWHAIYWALVTISTVGYGDISPVTVEGQMTSMLVIITGIGILSFSTSIVVTAFSEKLDEMREEKSAQKVEALKSFYLILGYSTMAQLVVKRLKRHKVNIVIIDKERHKVLQAQRDGCIGILGDATKLATYREMHITPVERIQAAMSLIDDEVQNIFITLTVRAISPNITLYARANSHSMVKKLRLAGAHHVVYAYESIGQMAKEYLGEPVVFEAISQLVSGHSANSVNEIALHPNDPIVGMRRESVTFEGMRLILLGVVRGKEPFVFNPSGDFVFAPHDVLILVGTHQSREFFAQTMLKRTRNRV